MVGEVTPSPEGGGCHVVGATFSSVLCSGRARRVTLDPADLCPVRSRRPTSVRPAFAGARARRLADGRELRFPVYRAWPRGADVRVTSATFGWFQRLWT